MDKKGTFIYILTLFYMVPLGVILTVNMFSSIFQSTYMEMYLDTEKPLYKADSPIILLFLVFLFIAVCGFVYKRHPVSKEAAAAFERAALIFSVIFSLFIIFLFRVGVACDGAAVSNIAVEFLKGKYSAFFDNNYLFRYSHQLSLVAFWELIYYVFGTENFIVLQFLNIVAIFSIIYFFHRITWELFNNYGIQMMLSVLCIAMLPLYLYATFIYGDVPGMGFAVPAVYYVMRYLNTRKRRLMIPSIICMTFAVLFKSNNIVILAAVVIILVLHLIKEKDIFAVIFAAALILAPTLFTSGINAYYAKEAGIPKIPDGAPKIAWVAMGLQENDYLENGWFNGYNCAVYEDCGFDAARTKAACMDSIKDSLQSFIASPGHGIRFFYKKFVSQWNDPTFQAQINIEWNSRHREDHSLLALYLIYGNGRFVLEGFMNVYHFLVLLGAAAFVVSSFRKTSLPCALLALCVFGGYFFHMFWEAKSRYGLGYFVMCVPMAAYGIWRIATLFWRIVDRLRK